jgi:hypothetical protein
MITTNVINKELVGNQTKVVVYLETQEICFVEDKLVDHIERGSEYHEFLHKNGIQHNHNKQTAIVTVFIDNPFTDKKLETALWEHQVALMMDVSDPNKFAPNVADIQEKATADGGINRTAYKLAAAPRDVVRALTYNFPDADLSAINLIGNPVWNTLLEKTILTVSMWKTAYPKNIFTHPDNPVSYRKYCIEDKKYFDKCYVATDEHPDFLPDCCQVKYKSFNMNIQEGLDIPDFVDYYFEGNPEHIEKELGLDYKRGKVSTKYGVTVYDGKIVRKKQYTYDEKTILENWD